MMTHPSQKRRHASNHNYAYLIWFFKKQQICPLQFSRLSNFKKRYNGRTKCHLLLKLSMKIKVTWSQLQQSVTSFPFAWPTKYGVIFWLEQRMLKMNHPNFAILSSSSSKASMTCEWTHCTSRTVSNSLFLYLSFCQNGGIREPLSFSSRFSSLTPYFTARLSLYLFLLASFPKIPPNAKFFSKTPHGLVKRKEKANK